MRSTLIKLMTVALLAVAPAMAQAQDASQYNQVESWYQRYLGRSAEPGGLQGHASALAHGISPFAVEGGILSSAEYFTRNGSNEANFIVALYRDVLGVTPLPQQVQQDLARLQQMGCDRQAFAIEFLQTRRVAYQPIAPQVVHSHRPAYLAPPRPVVVPGYRPAYYRSVPFATPYGPGAAIAVRQPGFGLGVAVR